MKKLSICFVLLFLCVFSSSFSQNFADKDYYLVDSLDLNIISEGDKQLIEDQLSIFHASNKDTIKINAISVIVENCWNEKVWPKYNKWVYDFSNKKLKTNKNPLLKKYFSTSLSGAIANIGYLHRMKSELTIALKYYEKAIKIQKDIGDTRGLADSYNGLGLIFNDQGKLSLSLEYYYKCLKLQNRINDIEGIAMSYNNIAITHKRQGNVDLALEFHFKSLKFQKETQDMEGMTYSYNNIAHIYRTQDSLSKALDYHNKAIQIQEKLGDKFGLALSYINIGVIYYDLNENSKALDYYNKSLAIRQEIGDKDGMVFSYINIGFSHFDNGEYNLALKNGLKAYKIANEIGVPMNIRNASGMLSKVYTKLGRYREALEMRNIEILMIDSLSNESTQKAAVQQQAKYEYEKKATADSVVNAEAKKIQDANLVAEKAENKRQQQQKYYLFGGLALALLFGGIVFNRFRTTHKQKGIIEKQKATVDQAFEQLEEKNTEILDSINYAKRIQSAILPPNKLVKEYLTSSFIHYKPKDIVAGDFYWMEPLKEGVLFAAADCTGHGVPGAMVSVVCNNGLNRSVREYGLTDPGEILNKTREIVIQEFEKSEDEVKDGMDIALCALHSLSPSHSVLHYAGAHNPLWIIRKGANEVEEIKANKQPIGQFLEPKPYATHKLELNQGDSIYIFSDGYPDQFGGEKGKKFKSGNFKKLLLSIQSNTMEEQEKILDKTFEEWRGKLEQIDDVCIIGVRI